MQLTQRVKGKSYIAQVNQPIIIFSSVRETHWLSKNMVRYLYNKGNDTSNESYTELRIWARIKYDPGSYGRILATA